MELTDGDLGRKHVRPVLGREDRPAVPEFPAFLLPVAALDQLVPLAILGAIVPSEPPRIAATIASPDLEAQRLRAGAYRMPVGLRDDLIAVRLEPVRQALGKHPSRGDIRGQRLVRRQGRTGNGHADRHQ